MFQQLENVSQNNSQLTGTQSKSNKYKLQKQQYESLEKI